MGNIILEQIKNTVNSKYEKLTISQIKLSRFLKNITLKGLKVLTFRTGVKLPNSWKIKTI